MSRTPTGTFAPSILAISEARRRARSSPRAAMPTRARPSAPLFRSRIAWAILVTARRMSPASSRRPGVIMKKRPAATATGRTSGAASRVPPFPASRDRTYRGSSPRRIHGGPEHRGRFRMFNGPVWFFLPFGLLFVGSFVVWIWALVDAIQVPDDSMYRSGTKLVWVLVILLTQVVGAIIYFAIGRPSRRTAPAIPSSG